MSDVNRDREAFAETGIMVTALPKRFMKDHSDNILMTIGSELKSCSSGPNTYAAFEVKPVSALSIDKRKGADSQNTGCFNIDLASHPNNRMLLEIVRYLSSHNSTLNVYGDRFDGRFYVKGFYPICCDAMSKETFDYLLSRIGIRFTFPDYVKTGWSKEDAENSCALTYKLLREMYPEGIRRYLDAHIDELNKYELFSSKSAEDVKRFALMNWARPELDLPTAKEARRMLDELVYGMKDAKERLLEFLEVVRRRGSLASNLLLVGPPGTGKTTLMQAVAKILRLPMSVVPMGACADVEAFVGFAKTYQGAQEGLVTTALMSPVFEHPDGRRETMHQIAQVMFLNELDKTGSEDKHRGSVQSAVLRMTDENRSFFDVYHQLEIDLSNVLVVADANDLSKIQKPLLDRFEIVEIPPYTEEEKTIIFTNYVFPSVLKQKCISPNEVSVTREAVSLIVSTAQTDGIRELKQVASRIAGNYLLHYGGGESMVCYTPDMVKPILPVMEIRHTRMVRQPGSIRSVILSNNRAMNVDVQCIVTRSERQAFSLYGAESAVLQQELEAAAICACRYLPAGAYDIKVQLFGVNDGAAAIGQLGFPVFIAVLSAAYNRIMNGVFYGGATLLGSLTSSACGNPDKVREFAARSGEDRFYTATGFAERMTGDHRGEVYEFLDAETAAALLFGINRLQKAM